MIHPEDSLPHPKISQKTATLRKSWKHPEAHVVNDSVTDLTADILKQSRDAIDKCVVAFNAFEESFRAAREVVQWSLYHVKNKISFIDVCGQFNTEPGVLRPKLLSPLPPGLRATLILSALREHMTEEHERKYADQYTNIKCSICGRKGAVHAD
jgi:hypothetical protein